MIVGICGLGLIGGSMAMAYKNAVDGEGNTVYGFDLDPTALGYARLCGAVDGVLDAESIRQCELVLVALYPRATERYLAEISPLVEKDTLVMDLCGIKESVCRVGFELAERYGYTFVGGHPMAGRQYSGIKYARAGLFKGAPMVIVPPRYDDIALLERVKRSLSPVGFGRFSVTTAREHDEMIAFTSQLAHVVSNAYIKSPTAERHKGFSAGSYKDMTRVAWLNEDMWSELFTENAKALGGELDIIIESLSEYRDAIKNGDRERLKELLRDGRLAKERIDG